MKRISWKPGAGICGVGVFTLLLGMILRLSPKSNLQRLIYGPLGLKTPFGVGDIVFWAGVGVAVLGLILTVAGLVAGLSGKKSGGKKRTTA